MTLDELFDHGKRFAAQAFKEQGQVHPMWVFEIESGDHIPLTIPPSMMADKEAVAEAVKKTLKHAKAVRYVSLLEAWAVRGESKAEMEKVIDNIDDVPIREHPKRTEVIQIVAEDKHHARVGYYTITRDSKGKGILSEFKEESGFDRMEGIFANLLDDATAVH